MFQCLTLGRATWTNESEQEGQKKEMQKYTVQREEKRGGHSDLDKFF